MSEGLVERLRNPRAEVDLYALCWEAATALEAAETDRDAWRNECSRLTSEFQAERERLRRALEDIGNNGDWPSATVAREALASGSAAEEIWTCPNCGKEWPLAPSWQGGLAGCWTCQGRRADQTEPSRSTRP